MQERSYWSPSVREQQMLGMWARPLDSPAEPEPQTTAYEVEAALNQEKFLQEIWTILIVKQPNYSEVSKHIYLYSQTMNWTVKISLG